MAKDKGWELLFSEDEFDQSGENECFDEKGNRTYCEADGS